MAGGLIYISKLGQDLGSIFILICIATTLNPPTNLSLEDEPLLQLGKAGSQFGFYFFCGHLHVLKLNSFQYVTSLLLGGIGSISLQL